MTQVILEETDRVDWALKKFRRKVQRSGILQDLKKKRYYTKPSLERRLRRAAAARRRRRAKRRGR